MANGRVALLVLAVAACGRGGASAPTAAHHDASVTMVRDAAAELPETPLGMADLAGFAWRKRAGQIAFRVARKAEDRGDWAVVVASCGQALANDPAHLEAAWLLAVGRAKLGQLDGVLVPLQRAVAGDPGKWLTPSLEQPALQPFLATPTGDAWRRRAAADRARYVAALARALIVNSNGDLFAFDPQGPRWYRLTSTGGAVVAALAVPRHYNVHQIGYVTRRRGKDVRDGLGVIDLATGHATKPTDLGAARSVGIAYRSHVPNGFIVTTTNGAQWQLLGDDGKLSPAPEHAGYFAFNADGLELKVEGRNASITSQSSDVNADWDDHGLASAMRLPKANRVVTAPSPSLIDGHSTRWSPDKATLAFVAIDERCTGAKPVSSSTAFVADGATGRLQQIETAHDGLAIEWLADRKLVVAGDHGVSIVDLGGGDPVVLAGATDLLIPRRKSPCTPEPAIEPVPVEDEPSVGDEPPDAGVPH